jgi:hypothetical protein
MQIRNVVIKVVLILMVTIFIYEIYYNLTTRSLLYSQQLTVYKPKDQTKKNNCIVNNALPDPACTPGATFANVTKDLICVSGYSKTVRKVSQKTKEEVYAAYNVYSHGPGEYEVDHFISLALGCSNETANLWPEAAKPEPGFRQKDKVENYLLKQVCEGKMTIAQAQKSVSVDWLKTYAILEPKDPLTIFYQYLKKLL